MQRVIPLYWNESVLWATRQGIRPASHPPCGFDGELCVNASATPYTTYVAIVAAAVVAVSITLLTAAVYIIRSRQQDEERLNQAWHVAYSSLSSIDSQVGTKTHNYTSRGKTEVLGL